jgi:hypothetical protein
MSGISLAQPLLVFDTNIVGEFSECVISIQQSAKFSIYSLPPEHEHVRFHVYYGSPAGSLMTDVVC